MRILISLIVAVGCLATIAFAAETQEPTARVETLTKRLQSGKIDGALIDFFSKSLAGEQKPTELRALDGQVKAALEFYGGAVSYEIVETKKMGNSLVRIKWITRHKRDAPLFWNAMFYHRNDKWEPLNLFFFDDPNKAGF